MVAFCYSHDLSVSVPTPLALVLSCVLSVSVPTRVAVVRTVRAGADAEQAATGNHASASVLYASERRKITEKKLKKFSKNY